MRKIASSGSLIASVLEAKEFAAKLPGRVNRVLDSLAASELKMKVELIDDGAIIDGLQKVANRITLGLILAAMIVSAAMVLRVDSSFRILGYSGFAMILFLLAGIGAGYLAVQIVRHDRSVHAVDVTTLEASAATPQPAPSAASASRCGGGATVRRRIARLTKAKGIATAWTRIRRLIWSWWPWALLSVYYIDQRNWWAAFGIAMWSAVCSLSTPAEFPPQYGLDHGLTVDDPEFLNTMAGAAGVPFVSGNAIELLNNGDRFYPSMLEAIEKAEHSITIEAYIYWAGEIGIEFCARVRRAPRSAGCGVKLLLDAVGSQSVGSEILDILNKGGCHLAWYNPIRWNHLRRINNRTHRKSLIIDGRVGFTGGAGIADHWTGNAQDAKHWRDLQIRIEGPAVRPLQTGFGRTGWKHRASSSPGRPFIQRPSPAGRLRLQTIMSSPETGASTVRVMYYLAISAARVSIDIANPYFVPDHVSIDLFRDAVKRGVKVRIMVAGSSNDTMVTRLNSVRLYGALLEAGVEVMEYNRTMMHHKVMIVDRRWSTVGTANFDNRSFSHNEESNVSVLDEGVAEQLTETFERDVAGVRARHARGLAAPQHRPQGHRNAGVVRAGSGLGHSRRRSAGLEHLAEEIPEPLVDLAVEGPLLRPRRGVETLRGLDVRLEVPVSCAARSAS